MSTISGQEILSRAAIILQDSTNIRWPFDELLRWLHDGQREVVLRKPDAYTKSEPLQLTVSETKQSIPAAGIQLLDVVRNLGTTGTTPGRAITRTERYILDAQRPNWNTETGSSVVKHYMFDERNPKIFYVYPPQPATSPGYIEIVYSASPDPLISTWKAATPAVVGDYCMATISDNALYRCTIPGTTGSTEPAWTLTTTPDGSSGVVWTKQSSFMVPQMISIDDIYASALLDYILYRAYSKDADIAPSAPQRAVGHYQAFLQSIIGKEQGESAYDANMPKPSESAGVHRG